MREKLNNQHLQVISKGNFRESVLGVLVKLMGVV